MGTTGVERPFAPTLGVRRVLSGPLLVPVVAWPATLLGWYYVTLVADPSWLRDRFLLAYLVTMLAIDTAICVFVLMRVTRRARRMLRTKEPVELARAREAWTEALQLPTRAGWLVLGLIALTSTPVTVLLVVRGELMLTLHGWTAALIAGACELTILFPAVQATTLPFLRALKAQFPELRLHAYGTPAPPLRAYFAFGLAATALVSVLLVARLIHVHGHEELPTSAAFPEGAATSLAAGCLLAMVGGLALQLYLAVLLPMRRLAAAMTSFAGGEGGVRVGLLHLGEVGVLSECFDDMVVSLGQSRTALEHHEALLRHAQRFEAMGSMAAAFAHEVANPLSGITINLEMATQTTAALVQTGRADAAQVAELREMLAEASASATQMGLLLRDMRAFGRSDTDDLEACDVAELLDGALRIAGGALRPGVVVREYEPTPRVRASPHKLSQVFLNLLLNAAQSLPAGRHGEFHVGVRAVPGGVEAWVRDNGGGIPQEVAGRVFEALYTTKPKGRGTGLGLHVSRQIVQSHAGRIWFETELGRETTFRVFLPGERAGEAA